MRIDDLPSPDKYWKTPAKREMGDANAEVIYPAMGFALHRWEVLETAFGEMFVSLTADKTFVSRVAAARTYGAITSNTGRRDILNAVSKVFFRHHKVDQLEQNQFASLIEHCGRASKRRDDIAHGLVRTYLSVNGVARGAFLGPPDYYKRQMQDTPFFPEIEGDDDPLDALGHNYRYTSEDIRSITNKLIELHSAAFEYHSKVIINKYLSSR
jgi:hypothetical protein